MNILMYLEADRTTDLFLWVHCCSVDKLCPAFSDPVDYVLHYITSLRVYTENPISKNKISCSNGICKMILIGPVFLETNYTGKKLRVRIQSSTKRKIK